MMKCKVCSHKERKKIDEQLVLKWRSTTSYRNIAKQYGLSYSSIYRHFCEHIPQALWKAERARQTINAENLFEQMNLVYRRVLKHLDACDRYLQDPENPTEYDLGPRGEDIMVVIQTVEAGSSVTVRRRLSELVADIEAKRKNLIIKELSWRHADPRKLLLDASREARGYFELSGKLLGEIKEILIIEDTERVRRLLRGWLQLIPAKKVPEARKIACEHGFDVKGGRP